MASRLASACALLLLATALACIARGATAATISQMYVFGDESADVGNANYFMRASVKANKAPYGLSFKPASGRFSDGKLVVDYLADFLGIASPRADLAPRNASLPFTGLDYAIVGAGAKSGTNGGKVQPPPIDIVRLLLAVFLSHIIIFPPPSRGFPFGWRQTRGLQLQFNEFKKWFNEAKRTNNPDLKLDEALFVVSIGANDYLAELSSAQPNMTNLVAIASSVSNTVINVIQSLYNLTGSSNIVVIDLPNLGCIPAVRRAAGSGINCTEAGNQITTIHNFALLTKTDKLRNNPALPMPNLVLFKQSAVFKTMIQVPTSVSYFLLPPQVHASTPSHHCYPPLFFLPPGLTNQTHPCCEAVTSTGVVVACAQTSGNGKAAVTAGPCAAPSKAVWWDARNPTQAVNQKVANTLFFSTNPGMVRPNGLRRFFSL
ncbi:unnamed protein product [Closterium sp. NIES-64]|nr:unnamed protein product [Closterium sp. NIES-64]